MAPSAAAGTTTVRSVRDEPGARSATLNLLMRRLFVIGLFLMLPACSGGTGGGAPAPAAPAPPAAKAIVLPQRPTGTDNWSEEQLAGLVSRDSMIGVSDARSPND